MQSLQASSLSAILSIISNYIDSGDWSSAGVLSSERGPSRHLLCPWTSCKHYLYSQGMAVSPRALCKWRSKMFSHMQDAIRYFDTHLNGDIMSYYTNDIDYAPDDWHEPSRSSSLPLWSSFLSSLSCSTTVLMALVILFIASLVGLATKNLGGKSAKNFVKIPKTTADVEGHIQEMMNGGEGRQGLLVMSQKLSNRLTRSTTNSWLFRNANLYANTLMPILVNMGNIMYVIGCRGIWRIYCIEHSEHFYSGLPFTIAVAVHFPQHDTSILYPD